MTKAAPDARRRIEYVRLDAAQRADRNAKAHDIPWITSLIAKFGFVGAAVHDGRTGKFIAGHGRLESLEGMAAEGQTPPDGIVLDADGAWMMPVEYGWSSRSDAEAEALGLALNEATSRPGWDGALLAEMLRDLDAVDVDLRRLAGWTDDELDDLIAGIEEVDPVPAASPEAAGAEPPSYGKQGASAGLDELSSNYDRSNSRILVLSYEGNRYVWAVERLSALATEYGVDSNADVVLKLLEDASGEGPPDA